MSAAWSPPPDLSRDVRMVARGCMPNVAALPRRLSAGRHSGGGGLAGREPGNPHVADVDLEAARVHADPADAVVVQLEADVPVRTGRDVDVPVAVRVAVRPLRITVERAWN